MSTGFYIQLYLKLALVTVKIMWLPELRGRDEGGDWVKVHKKYKLLDVRRRSSGDVM